MPVPKGDIFEAMRMGVTSEEQLALQFIYPTKDKYKQLKMLSDLKPRTIVLFTVLDVMRRRFKSDVLKMIGEEYYMGQKARERLGIGEALEILAAVRRPREGEEE